MTGRSPKSRFRTAALALVWAAVLGVAACTGAKSAPSAGPSSSGAAPAGALPPADPAALQRVVPQPVTLTPAGGAFALTAAAVIHAPADAAPIGADLAAALKQQTGSTLAVDGAADAGGTPGILLDLQAAGTDPAVGAEGYQLDVGPGAVKLSANSAAGLFHGVQTLRQLVTPGANGAPATLPAGHVTDYPRYAYRGVMLDVARHFFSVADVKAYIDAVSLYKVNQLHLHLTDDQGWRLEVPSWPKLTTVGGSTQVGGGPGGFYTAADYKAIVDYAASRYMTVIPEIDMPGHVGAAVASYPQLGCDGRKHTLVTSVSPAFDSLCTTRESPYTFVDNVVGAAAGLTPGPSVAIGGDEAQALNQTQYDGFVKRAQDLVVRHGKTPMAWAEIASGPILPSTVAEYWNTAVPQPYLTAAAAKGTKLVMAPGDHAYLDQQYNSGFPLGLHWAGYVPVSKAYDWDPVTILPGVPPTAVLGVEATLFTETVKNLGNAETLSFPRLPAIAEIGWSAPKSHDWTGFSQRLGKQAHLWDLLGIRYFRSPEVPWS